MLNVSNEHKTQLRKIRTIAHKSVEAARNTLVTGCIEQGAYMQFGRDVTVYGLWEALLYASNYEGDGAYEVGTAQKALDAAVKKLK